MELTTMDAYPPMIKLAEFNRRWAAEPTTSPCNRAWAKREARYYLARAGELRRRCATLTKLPDDVGWGI